MGRGDARLTRLGSRRIAVTRSWICVLIAFAAAGHNFVQSSSIYCGDERYCDGDQTCCKSKDAGTHYFCCEARGATCCSDMQSCCPPDFPVCDLVAGGCIGGKHSRRGAHSVDEAEAAPRTGHEGGKRSRH
jgi:hypothetical protein